MIKETYRVLKPGGVCYFETPNPNSLVSKAMGEQWWMFIDLHLILLPPKYMRNLFSEVGFTDVVAGSRAEIDVQIDEAKEICLRLTSIGLLAQILHILPTNMRYKLVAWYIQKFPRGGITTLSARKPLQSSSH